MMNVLGISFAVASLSMTVSVSKVTEPLRVWAFGFHPALGELLACPYCLSHWLAFGLVLWCRPLSGFSGIVIATFAAVTLACFWSILIGHFLELMDKWDVAVEDDDQRPRPHDPDE